MKFYSLANASVSLEVKCDLVFTNLSETFFSDGNNCFIPNCRQQTAVLEDTNTFDQ
jgi:hypothetical protein